MSQSLVRNLIHLIWSTRNRRPLITSDLRNELETYMAGTIQNTHSTPIKIGAVEDHIHCLVGLSKKTALMDFLREIKRSSSEWCQEQGPEFQHFKWQGGYAGFSVSESKKEEVIQYIDRQWTYHQRFSYREELQEFIERHDLDVNVEYNFDG